jgi:hypothetical protein
VARFESTWSAKTSVSECRPTDDQAMWRITAAGPNWRVETDFRLVRWDDIIDAAAARPTWRRLGSAVPVFVDFVAAGALWRYFRGNWRYALFFLYPFVMLAAFVALAWMAGDLAARAGGSLLLGVASGVLVLVALLRWLSPRLHVAELIDDWTFARDYIRRPDPALEARLDRIAREIQAATERTDTDEILIIGHSLGAVLGVDILDRMLKLDPARDVVDSRLAFVSVGSSIPKIALHRGATRFRDALRRVGATRTLFWAEYQALVDVMNFFKSDILADVGLKGTGRPALRIVRIREMLNPDFYRRIRRNFYRLHAQFISGNDRRMIYDYFMMVCGPLTLKTQVYLPAGAGSVIDEQGALTAGALRPPARSDSPAAASY